MAKDEIGSYEGFDAELFKAEFLKRATGGASWVGVIHSRIVGGVPIINTSDIYAGKYIKDNFHEPIKNAFKACGFSTDEIQYTSDDEVKGRQIPLPDKSYVSLNQNNRRGSGDRSKSYNIGASIAKTPKPIENFVIHRGLEATVNSIKDINPAVRSSAPYLIFGEHLSGKTALLNLTIETFKERGIRVSYIDLNKLSRDLHENYMGNEERKKNGRTSFPLSVTPSYVKEALRSEVLLVDNLGGLYNENSGARRTGVHGIAENLLSHFSEEGKLIVMAFTGDIEKYSKMVERLKNVDKNKPRNKESRNLGEILGGAIRKKVSAPEHKDRPDFIRKYLENAAIVYRDDLERATNMVHNSLPVGADFRAIIGKTETLLHSIQDSRGELDYEVVSGLLGGVGQREMFGNYVFPENLLNNIAEHTGIPVEEISGKSRAKKVVDARHLSAWALSKETTLTLKDIGKLIGRNHATVLNSVNKVNDILSRGSGFSNGERKLFKILTSWKEKQSF